MKTVQTNQVQSSTFGQTLRTTRQSHKVTLKQVASQLGVATSTVWKMEKGKTPVTREDLNKINDYYGTNLKFPKTGATTTTTKQTGSYQSSVIEGFEKTKRTFVKYLQETINKIEAL